MKGVGNQYSWVPTPFQEFQRHPFYSLFIESLWEGFIASTSCFTKAEREFRLLGFSEPCVAPEKGSSTLALTKSACRELCKLQPRLGILKQQNKAKPFSTLWPPLPTPLLSSSFLRDRLLGHPHSFLRSDFSDPVYRHSFHLANRDISLSKIWVFLLLLSFITDKVSLF